MLLSFPGSYANENGATIFKIPTTQDNFPENQEELETLLHHKTGLKEPRLYKYKAPKYSVNIMHLIPLWLKENCNTLPLAFVREESATQIKLSQYPLSQAIEMLESDEHHHDVSFVSIADARVANTLQKCDSLLCLSDTHQHSSNFLNHTSLLCPLNYKEKRVSITRPSNFLQKIFKRRASAQKIKRQISRIHKKLQFILDQPSLTLSTHTTFLEMSNKHHVEHLHQNTIHVSNVIVQTHGRQKVVLMPPVSKKYSHRYLLDTTGAFLLNGEVDFSAPNSTLNNEQLLAHTTLYSVYLNPGDLLLIPANWFIYRKSLSTSVSVSLNYLSGDAWHLLSFQAEPIQYEYLTQENRAVQAWASMEKVNDPANADNITLASKKIQKVISNTTRQKLDLSHLDLMSLPDAIARIPHLKILNLQHNKLTSFSLSHMKNLVSLDLSHNQLSAFLSCDFPSVIHIQLHFNRLSTLGPHGINRMHSHQSIILNLKNNPWSSEGISQIQDDLYHND